MALGVLVAAERRRERAGNRPQIRQQSGQLSATGAHIVAELGRICVAGEGREHLDERLVRGAHHGVAGAVEDRGTVCRGFPRKLADEPALARAGLSADQRHAPPLRRRPGLQ